MAIKMYRVKWFGVNINLTVIIPFLILSGLMLWGFNWMGW